VTLRFSKFWLGCGAAFVVLVVYLSLTPDPLSAGSIGMVKVGHVAAYLWLMLWFSQVCRSLAGRSAVAVGLIAMGIALEYAQGATSYRTFAFSDMRDNAFGVLIGFALSWTALGSAALAVERFHTRRADRHTS